MKNEQAANVRRACAYSVRIASQLYEVPTCSVRVLATRPTKVREQWTMVLFGDYAPETMVIKVWMRTAVRKEITSFGTFLSTLCHEFCHHLDFKKFKFADSWHTRGFYERAAVLYHHARGTPRKGSYGRQCLAGAGGLIGRGHGGAPRASDRERSQRPETRLGCRGMTIIGKTIRLSPDRKGHDESTWVSGSRGDGRRSRRRRSHCDSSGGNGSARDSRRP